MNDLIHTTDDLLTEMSKTVQHSSLECVRTAHAERRKSMKKNEYSVPKEVYYQCLWLIKDIDRLRKLEAVSNYAAEEDELVFFVDDEDVIRDAKVLDNAKWRLNCIRQALIKIPEEYRQSTLDCISYNIPYSDMAHENTWRKWRQVLIWELAKNLFLI